MEERTFLVPESGAVVQPPVSVGRVGESRYFVIRGTGQIIRGAGLMHGIEEGQLPAQRVLERARQCRAEAVAAMIRAAAIRTALTVRRMIPAHWGRNQRFPVPPQA
jgi:hypothetical protein